MEHTCRLLVGKISGFVSEVYIHGLKIAVSSFLSFCQDVVFMNNPVEGFFSDLVWVLFVFGFVFYKYSHLKKVSTRCYSLIHYSVIEKQTMERTSYTVYGTCKRFFPNIRCKYYTILVPYLVYSTSRSLVTITTE